MSYQTFRVRLNAATFPFISSFSSRTVLIPGLDNTVRSAASAGTNDSVDTTLPQMIYAHNVIPTGEGVMSVGFDTLTPSYGAVTDFDQVFTLRDDDENNFLFAPAGGKNYIFAANAGAWVPTNSFTGWTGRVVTRAYVNGRTLVCYEGRDIYEYSTGALTFLPVTITGLTLANILGICGSSNYCIAWDDVTIYWSSLISPTDFAPSLSTGAGFEIPQDVKGRILACYPVSGGFMIYTTKNVVAASFTNNSRAPFIFREVANSGGINISEAVAADASLAAQYAWTSGGMQKLSMQAAETVFPECTDFLAGRIYEDFVSSLLVQSHLTTDMSIKLTYTSSRYLVISYGLVRGAYTFALLYDTALKRWGKLKITHVDAFHYPYPNLIGPLQYEDLTATPYSEFYDTTYADLELTQSTTTPPRRSLAFLQEDGTVKVAILDYRTFADDAVMVLGKYQLTRKDTITLQTVEVESVPAGQSFTLGAILSTDGLSTGAATALTLISTVGNFLRYGKRLTAKNFSLLFQGTFEASTVVMTVTQHGNR